MTAMIVTSPILDAGNPLWRGLEKWQCVEACEWVRAHGFDPMFVLSVEIGVVDCPFLRVTSFDHARCKPVCTCEDLTACSNTMDVAMRTPQPSWWQPS